MAAFGALFIVLGVTWIVLEPRVARTDRHLLATYFGVSVGPRYLAFRRRLSVVGGAAFVVIGLLLVLREVF